MIYLRYLRVNMAKICEINENWRLKLSARPTSGICLYLLHWRAHLVTMAIKGGRDSHEYCTPDTDSVFVVCPSTGV